MLILINLIIPLTCLKEQATENLINTEIDKENETPQEFRKKLRAGNGKLKPTSGLCPGYQQVNALINAKIMNYLI